MEFLRFASLSVNGNQCEIDGKACEAKAGAWAVYIPAFRAKFLHSRNGLLTCLHPVAPPRAEALSWSDLTVPMGIYTRQDWMNAYRKDVVTRVAENYITAKRLHAHGLGPKPLGFCYARHYRHADGEDERGAFGFLSEDVNLLPVKADASEEEILASGVTIDRLRSCFREQLRGYVIDLNSVVGVVPVDAEEEITETRSQILRGFDVKAMPA